MQAPQGYVIGLHGQWGSGKSSVMNFVLAMLKKHNQENEDDQVVHIDFRPWLVSGHQDLIVAFFKILSESLGPKKGWWTLAVRGVASVVDGTTDRLVDAAATVALTVDPTAGVASGVSSDLAKKGVKSLISRFLQDPSLQAAYENLKTELKETKKRFLVTIDDIDRLEDDDVRSIMQMVKSIGRLPNVTYLLSYDREIVWDALDKGTKRAGPRFAEKIVQQEIELPVPRRNALLALLDQEIAFLTKDTPNNSRWQYLVRDGVQRWIRTPRDVVRLSNAVKFCWPAIEGEIDPQDLLAMEGLRIFDNGAFNWVRDNRDFFFNDGRFFLANEKVREDASSQLKDRLRDSDRQQVLRVLTVLFPRAAKWFEGEGFSEENPIEVDKRRGIGSEAGYDTYFGLHPSRDVISKTIIDGFMARLDDADEIEHAIRGYLGKTNSRGEPMVGKFLDELRLQFKGYNPAEPTQPLLDALFRVGEEIISMDYVRGMFELAPGAQIGFLIRNMLEQWGQEKAGGHLIQAFENAASTAFMADIYVDRGRELGVFKSDSSEQPAVTKEDFDKLGKILLADILEEVANGTLADAPFYFDIIRAWAYLGNPQDVKQWLSEGIVESAIFLAKAGQGLVSYSIGTDERKYTMREEPNLDYYDVDILHAAAKKHVASDDLNQDQRRLVAELLRATENILNRRSAGDSAAEAE